MTNAVRAAWLAVAALPSALQSGGASVLSPFLVWAAWAFVAVAVLVPHPLSLSTVRFVAPLLVMHGGWLIITEPRSSGITDAERWGSVGGFFVMLTVAIATYAATYGAAHAQAAAYGHERRHLLRPPISVILPLVVVWLAVATSGAVAVHATSLVVAAIATAIFTALTTFALRRAMVLARRWLVFVPAGIAVHDPLMLRDTFMVRSQFVRALHVAPPGTEAFDTTGTTWGVAIELVLSHPHDVSLSEFGARIGRTLDRVHVTALLVAPSRLGRALANDAAGEHRAV